GGPHHRLDVARLAKSPADRVAGWPHVLGDGAHAGGASALVMADRRGVAGRSRPGAGGCSLRAGPRNEGVLVLLQRRLAADGRPGSALRLAAIRPAAPR